MGKNPSILAAIAHTTEGVTAVRPLIARTLERLESENIFSLPQALTLVGLIQYTRPSIVIDLGTGSGASSMSMAMADSTIPVYTIDRRDEWSDHIRGRVRVSPRNLHFIVADIATYDFSSLLKGVDGVLIFWDAHGYDVAARVFSHIMPIVCEASHLVICHDISDNRQLSEEEGRSYGGKRMYRGMRDFFENVSTTAYLNVGWMATAVEQALSIQDFCFRNRMTVGSLDYDIMHRSGDISERLEQLYPEGIPYMGLTYFSMNDTSSRHFPAG